MPDHIDRARRLIESRLAEIDTEAGQLERAVAGMGEGSVRRRGRPRRHRKPTVTATVASATPAPAGPKPGRHAGGRSKAGRRAARGQRREELLVAIEAAPGARPSELASSIGIGSTQVHALIARARAEKLIVKSGQGYALKR
jgi:hypothetical protein